MGDDSARRCATASCKPIGLAAKTETSASRASSCLRFLLHELGYFQVHVEELGSASVEADTLALVQVAFAVIIGDALLCADFRETVQSQSVPGLEFCMAIFRDKGGLPVLHVHHQLHLHFHRGNLLRRRRLRPTETEERHLWGWLKWLDCGAVNEC